jgi:alcohol dehydrogenase
MGCVKETGEQALKLGAKKALLISGPNVERSGNLQPVLDSLKAAGVEYVVQIESRNTPEPTAAIAEEVAAYAKEQKVDCVIGIGGGSVLDVAKMSAALVVNPLRVRDYFGKEKLPSRGIPTIMVPTTSGTGAEVTKHAIFLDEETNVKKAVASSNLLPNTAIVDPMLTVSCPAGVTASAGFDAFLHAAEPFVSKAANPITDSIALEAIAMISKWIGPAYADGSNLDARYYMSMGSIMAGMVLNNAGTSLVHALAYPIGGEYHVSHGKSLTPILLACFDSIMVVQQENFVRMAKAMGENVKGLAPRHAAKLCMDALRELMLRLGLPVCLNDLNITDKSRVDQWAVDAHAEQRLLSRCARNLSVEDIKKIYLASFSD